MKPLDIFITIAVVAILMVLGASTIERFSNSKSYTPRTYTVKTQDESYSGLRFHNCLNSGLTEFLDKDNKKHVFSGNFRYVEE